MRPRRCPAIWVLLAALVVPPVTGGLRVVGAAETEPTFEDVFADPDDPELNFRYARARLKAGDFRSALTALERVLLAEPRRHDARVLYALTLFRLDAFNEASSALDALSKLGLPPELTRQLGQLRTELGRRRAKTRLTGVLGLGYDADSNRNAAPISGKRLVEDHAIDLRPDLLAQSDTSLAGFARIEGRREFAAQARHEAFVRLDLQRSESSKFSVLDLQVYSGQAGLTLRTPWARLVPWGGADHLRLSEETLLRVAGGGLRAERDLGPTSTAHIEGRAAYHDYSATSDVPNASERSGRRAELAAGLSFAPAASVRLGLGYAVVRQEAAREYNAYDRHSFHLLPEWLPGRGAFVQGLLGLAIDRYHAPDFLVSSRYRYDDIYRARLTVGASLGFLGSWFQDVIVSQSVEYQHAISNLTNYDYENKKLSTQLAYVWGWSR